MDVVICLLKGILIGLLFGVPIGAVGALTVQNTLEKGLSAGLLTGLGSSVADSIYAVIGVFGLTVLSDFLLANQRVISLMGGVLLMVMGVSQFQKKKQTKALPTAHRAGTFFTSFFIGITNPAAILTFLFAFTYFQLAEIQGVAKKIAVVVGVLIGTYVWWCVLSLVTTWVAKRRKAPSGVRMHVVFGLILLVFGVIVVVNNVI